MKKLQTISGKTNLHTNYYDYLIYMMCMFRNRKDDFGEFLYKYYQKIYDACQDKNIVGFKCNKICYEMCEFHNIFRFIVGVYLDDYEHEISPDSFFIPIYKTQPEETER